MGSTVGGAVGNVRDGAGEAVSTVAQGANQAADEVGLRLDRFMKASPLAVGAIAVGAGVLAGTIIPDTPQEQELLGDASRQVVNTVRQTVDDVATKAEEALDETEQKVSSNQLEQTRHPNPVRVRGPGSSYRPTMFRLEGGTP